MFAGVELQLFEFGQSIDQFGHRSAELFDQLLLGDAAILHGIVHERSHEGLGIQFPFGALHRYCNGVGDVRVAAFSELAQMRLVGEAVGPTDGVDVSLGQIVQPREQCRKAGSCSVGCCSGGLLLAGSLQGGHASTLAAMSMIQGL